METHISLLQEMTLSLWKKNNSLKKKKKNSPTLSRKRKNSTFWRKKKHQLRKNNSPSKEKINSLKGKNCQLNNQWICLKLKNTTILRENKQSIDGKLNLFKKQKKRNSLRRKKNPTHWEKKTLQPKQKISTFSTLFEAKKKLQSHKHEKTILARKFDSVEERNSTPSEIKPSSLSRQEQWTLSRQELNSLFFLSLLEQKKILTRKKTQLSPNKKQKHLNFLTRKSSTRSREEKTNSLKWTKTKLAPRRNLNTLKKKKQLNFLMADERKQFSFAKKTRQKNKRSQKKKKTQPSKEKLISFKITKNSSLSRKFWILSRRKDKYAYKWKNDIWKTVEKMLIMVKNNLTLWEHHEKHSLEIKLNFFLEKQFSPWKNQLSLPPWRTQLCQERRKIIQPSHERKTSTLLTGKNELFQKRKINSSLSREQNIQPSQGNIDLFHEERQKLASKT